MTRDRLRAHRACMAPVAALAATLACLSAAVAQERSGGFLDNLFNRGEQQQPQDEERAPPPGPRLAQSGGSDEASRIDRIENALRQLTGTVERLQHDNQMLQMQLKRLQDDTEYRFQQMGGRAGQAPAAAAAGVAVPPASAGAPPGGTGRRGDVFDPNQNPNAPGAPRPLGNASASALPPAPNNPPIMNERPVGAPGGRDAGAPLDLSTLAANPPAPSSGSAPQTGTIPAPQTGPLPPVMAPGNAAPGAQLATLPPSASPKDEYELAYGYVLHKDYALAAQAFTDFIHKYPSDKLLPEAQYWLGESLFQQQRYRDAAESFLAVSTKYERSSKAPEALLRLGQSLAALHQKEAACATLAEVGRKYPHAPASVKRSVAQEQKRGHC
jgi:tol-pal system protein YbgF